MVLSDPEVALRALILQEEQRIRASFSLERRLGLMEIVRAADYFSAMQMLGVQRSKDDGIGNLIEFGINKAIKLFADESWRSASFPLMQSTIDLQQWADSVLQHCGRLGICEQLLDICRVGLGSIEAEGPCRYFFRYTSDPIGLESFEREDGQWFQRFVAKQQEGELEKLSREKPRIRKLLSSLVKPWNKFYIQYEAHPEVDEHYEREGILFAQRLFGHDVFSGESVFGGEPFNLYRATVGLLIGWCLKHIDFCLELLNKNPEISPRNILTVPQDRDVKIYYLAAALGIDFEVAYQALSVVTLNLDNVDKHCSVPGNFAAPAVIAAGADRLICPIWGSLTHPFQFMIEELRRVYRSDWDRAVDGREHYFRDELYQLFTGDRFEKSNRNVLVKSGSAVLTDIDAIVLDRKAGVVGVFQLKWQDYFRHSIRERESRKRNFQGAGDQWVARIVEWLSCRSAADSAKNLGFSEEVASEVEKFNIFVIGRSAAYFSGPGLLDPRAAWGNWYQVLRIFEGISDFRDPLSFLFDALGRDSPLYKSPPSAPEMKLKIRDTVIRIEAVNRGSRANFGSEGQR